MIGSPFAIRFWSIVSMSGIAEGIPKRVIV